MASRHKRGLRDWEIYDSKIHFRSTILNPVTATNEVNISLCRCIPGAEGTPSEVGHTVKAYLSVTMRSCWQCLNWPTLTCCVCFVCSDLRRDRGTSQNTTKATNKNTPQTIFHWNSCSSYGPLFTLLCCFVYFANLFFKSNRRTQSILVRVFVCYKLRSSLYFC